jgi:hypothetical protein
MVHSKVSFWFHDYFSKLAKDLVLHLNLAIRQNRIHIDFSFGIIWKRICRNHINRYMNLYSFLPILKFQELIPVCHPHK